MSKNKKNNCKKTNKSFEIKAKINLTNTSKQKGSKEELATNNCTKKKTFIRI